MGRHQKLEIGNRKPIDIPVSGFWFPVSKWTGTWFGVGLSPIAPGTMGSIAALPFAYVIQVYMGNVALFIAGIIAFFAGWLACHLYLPYVDAQDPREMVIDEVAAQWLLLSAMQPTLIAYMVGLALFRFFDIVKPWPISVADRKIHGGFGVMFDDVLAVLYPLAIVWAVIWIAALAGYSIQMQGLFHVF